MNTFFNPGNIINFVLILLSLSVSAWCVYRCKRGNKRRKLYYTGIALSLLVIALCIRGSYKIFHYCDLYNKIVRPTKSYYLNELTLSPEECREDFEEIMDIVQENYASLAHHKHIDLAKLNEAYKEEVSGVKDAEQYGLLLLQYFSALKNMHTYPFFSRYQSGAYVVSRNDSVWVSKCLNKSVDLQRKDLIIAIDGMPTADYIKKEMETTPASTDVARKKTAAINIFASYTDTCKQVTVQRGDSVFNVLLPLFKEEEMIVALKKQANATDSSRIYLPSVIAPKVSSLLAKTLKRYDNIGYIRIHDFDPGSVEDFCRQIKEEFKCPYLILNLQGNLGGIKGNVMNIASYLISKSITIGNAIVKNDTAKCYKGKLFVLTDRMTSSGAESLVAILKEQPNVMVIGCCTAGDCGSTAFNFKTSHGIEFKLATESPFLLPDGVTWSEGQGIAPDIEVEENLPWEEKNAFSITIDLINQDKLKNNAYEFK